MRLDLQLHVAFDGGAHRSIPAGVVAHWRRGARHVEPVDDVRTAFTQFTRCGSPLDVVIAADSLLNIGLLTETEIAGILGGTARGRRILQRIDGNAESGIESIVRTQLRARGVGLRTQVKVAGVGRVDFVVGDRLVIEVDGRDWHDTPSQFEQDRARDARLVALGYVVLRFSYQRVMRDLVEVLREILAVVRAGDHRRSTRHDRIARNYG